MTRPAFDIFVFLLTELVGKRISLNDANFNYLLSSQWIERVKSSVQRLGLVCRVYCYQYFYLRLTLALYTCY